MGEVRTFERAIFQTVVHVRTFLAKRPKGSATKDLCKRGDIGSS